MEVRDYNGTGEWTRESVNRRYHLYCRRFGVTSIIDLSSREHVEGNVKWIYPIMEDVIYRIEHSDKASIELGIDFIEQDQKFTFGRILKSNTARALRRADLSQDQIDRIRKRIVAMLVNGSVPHEYKEYAKLLRKIGIGEWWKIIEEKIPRDNEYVMQYYEYFRKHASI